MIKVVLEVEKGVNKDKIYEFDEPNTFIVGRDGKGTKAHYRLEKDDKLVSRNHFMLEINPPDCYLTDIRSLNGTYLIRKDGIETVYFIEGRVIKEEWQSIATEITKEYLTTPDSASFNKIISNKITLKNGDLICIGDSALRIKVETIEEKNEPKIEITEEDIEIEEINRKKTVGLITCFKCNKQIDILQMDTEGGADELKDIALYLCESCAKKEKKDPDIDELGSYNVLYEINRGGNGIVYFATHKRSGRVVAIKVPLEKIKKEERLLLRFKREIFIMRNLNHKNLVKLYDGIIEENEKCYFICEYLKEGSLRDLIKNKYNNKPLPYKDACNYIIQSLEGLAHFHEHEKKYVHRDLKPENIFVKKDEHNNYIAKVGDFGLSRSYIFHGETITKKEEFAGTHQYLPPDQIYDFTNAKPYTDTYSMGITMYNLLTLQFPYNFPTKETIREDFIAGRKSRMALDIILGDDKPIPIQDKVKNIPKELAQVINKSIEKVPTKRFQTANEFKNAIMEAIKCK